MILPVSSAAPNPVPVIGGYFQPGGMYEGYSGYHYWVNYDPSSGEYGVLEKNPKGTVEGELTSSVTDTDYDGCTGADKLVSGARYWLIPATQDQIDEWYHPHKEVAQPQQPVIKHKTQEELMFDALNQYKDVDMLRNSHQIQ